MYSTDFVFSPCSCKMARAQTIIDLLKEECRVARDPAAIVAEYAHELHGLPVSQKEGHVVDLVASSNDFLVLTNHSIGCYHRGDSWASLDTRSIVALDEDLVAGVDVQGLVTVWRGGQFALSWQLEYEDVVLTKLSGTLFACRSRPSELDVFDASTGMLVSSFTVATFAIAPITDKLIAVGLMTGEITIRSLESPKCVRVLRRHKNAITALTALHGGKLVSAANDGTMRVWDWTTGTCLKTVSCYNSTLDALVALPDGRFAAGYTNGKVTLWTPECNGQTLVDRTKG